jgi:hypothetical protein
MKGTGLTALVVVVGSAILAAAGWPLQGRLADAGGRPMSAPHDDLVIERTGTLTAADKGTYQEHVFDVPAGVTRVAVEFSYQNQGNGTELEVGLFDPHRFRGTSRFSKARFHITEFEATPSYLPGPIDPGPWRLSLGVPSIGAAQSSVWHATIRLSTSPTPRDGLGPTLRDQAGWYVGDLHAHTLHSDGYGCADPETPQTRRGCQPWEVVEAARAKHLDFLAITDHNTTSHHQDLATLQESLPSLLLIRGQELTTFRGHANVYGTSRIIDFRLGFRGRAMTDVMNDVASQGALLSINHPARDTGDRCTGCGWDAPATPWERIEAMEVVNGGVIEGRNAGMPFWYARLNEGRRITAIGGSDDHGARPNGRIGSPATVIFAKRLSEADVLDGIRAGRVYVRTRGPQGPAIDVTGTIGDRTVSAGAVVPLDRPATLRLDVHVGQAAQQTLEVVKNGSVVERLTVPSADAHVAAAVSVSPADWVHLRVRDAAGLTAFTNPIYAR